ncbi:MAG: hypothetical protein ACREH6_01515 [Geminicoccaceae bacterium]
MALSACAGDLPRIPATGVIDDQRIEGTVDSAIAKYYLENYLPRQNTRPDLDRALADALGRLSDPPRREEYRQLSERFSVDLATLQLIRVLSAEPANLRARRLFRRELERVRALSGASGRLAACVARFELPTILFVPGWFYRSQQGTGADFAAQRALLGQLGVDARLIPVRENGTVEENAQIIAREVRRFDPAAGSLILVSASIGGPEVAQALGYVLKPAETGPVAAWVNVGGLLKGSPLADWASVWPRNWLARLYYWWKGLDASDSIASLTTTRSIERFAHQTIPDHILIVNFVGIPLSGDISPGAEFGYLRTSAAGPNDGLAPILDEIAHGGQTILQVGLDHYYRDPEIDLKTLALALTVTLELGHAPPACEGKAAA